MTRVFHSLWSRLCTTLEANHSWTGDLAVSGGSATGLALRIRPVSGRVADRVTSGHGIRTALEVGTGSVAQVWIPATIARANRGVARTTSAGAPASHSTAGMRVSRRIGRRSPHGPLPSQASDERQLDGEQLREPSATGGLEARSCGSRRPDARG